MNGLMRSHRLLAVTAASVFCFFGASHATEAKELSYAIGFAPGSMVDQAAQAYAERIADATNGDITIQVYPLSLMNLIETGPGLRDNLADIGYVLSPYYAAEYVHSNLINELNMSGVLREASGAESLAFTGAVIEYVMTKCPTCLAEFEAQSQIYMGGGASTPYMLLCNKPVTSETELNGKRIRSGAGSFQRFAEHFNAVGVQLAANEVFEGLSQGVIDCAMLSAPDLQNLVLEELVSDITLGIPGGIYTSAQVNVNTSVWQDLTDDQRAAFLQASAFASAHMSWTYHESAAKVLEAAEARGTNIHEPSSATIEAMQAFVRADHEKIAAQYQETYGVANAKEMAAEFMPVLDRWHDLVADVESMTDLEEVYWNEIYSKIDPSTYGMN